MPRLARLRLVNVGHPDARFDDLTLNFRDEASRACDAVVWLRNAGGKSSILNLFFTLMRPSKNEFLGGASGGAGNPRLLEHYVLEGDRAVIVAEWELDEGPGPWLDGWDDPAGGTVRETVGPARYLTGAFYERATSPRSEAVTMNRLNFAARVVPGDPAFTLEGLPLYVEHADGKRGRLSLVQFKQEWHNRGLARPVAQAKEVPDHAADWMAVLDGARLDPELFRYQLRMNRREGGADNLFQFANAEAFVDFFLELTLDPELCERLADNLEAFRALLIRRRTHLLPERGLIQGVLARLEPLATLHVERTALQHRVRRAGAALHELIRHCQEHHRRLSEQALHDQVSLDAAQRLAGLAEDAEKKHRHQAAAWRGHAEAWRGRQLTEAEGTAREQVAATRQAQALWTAALPFREAMRHRKEAAEHGARLERLRTEHAPKLTHVRSAAARYGHAVKARLEGFRREQEHQRRQAEVAHAEVIAHREAVAAHGRISGQQEARARDLDHRIQEAARARARLEDAGVFTPGEVSAEAVRRWTTEMDRQETAGEHAHAETQRLQAQLGEEQDQRTAATRYRLTAESDRTTLRATVDAATTERRRLEHNSLLQQCLDRELLDLETVDPDDTTSRVREVAATLQTQVHTLRAELAAEQSALNSLTASGRLPPDPDVARVLQALEGLRVLAWSGWEYLAQNIRVEERHAFIAATPEVADGVVVPPGNWMEVLSRLPAAVSMLNRPVTVVPQNAFKQSRPAAPTEEGSPEETVASRLVVGPTSDAHFDPEIGRAELSVRQARADRHTATLQGNDEELAGLRGLAAEFQNFRARYPLGWFAIQAAAEAALVGRSEEARTLEAQIGERIATMTTSLRTHAAVRERCRREHGTAKANRQRAEDYLETYGTGEDARQGEHRDALNAVAAAQSAAAREREAAAGCDARAAAATKAASAAGERAAEEAAALSGIEHFDVQAADETVELSNLADSEALGRSYRDLAAEYAGLIGDEQARGLQQRARDDEQAALARYRRAAADAPGLGETTVRAALETLSDQGDAEQRLQTAMVEAAQAASHLEVVEKARKDSEGRLEKLNADYRSQYRGLPAEFPHPPEEFAASPERIEGAAADKVREAEDHQQRAKTQRTIVQTTRERHGAATREAERFQSCYRRLTTLKNSHDRILNTPAFTGEEPAIPADTVAPTDPRETEAAVDSLEIELSALGHEVDGCDTRRNDAIASMQTWLDREEFAAFRLQLIGTLRATPPDELERTADEKRGTLSLRAVHLQAEIDSADGHRSRIAEVLFAAAQDGLNALRTAERYSRLPDGLGTLSGHSFLKIATQEPADRAERLDLVRQVVDAIASADARPLNGTALVQRAVRHLAQSVKASVLFPDPDSPVRSVPVADMARQSGGERLTCAVLLYCALARLRAQRRGTGDRRAGALILDNPLGTASRRKFVRLQRAAARAMGVQLLYTTAVEDLEALSEMPAIIRLRNDRRDRLTHQRGVELDQRPARRKRTDPGTPTLSAARLVRSEELPAASTARAPGKARGSHEDATA